MNVTVVIPTHRRAPLLRASLESIRNQSRQDVVAEVVVSENSEDRGSADVVKCFPDLPVRYIAQNPPVDPGTHFNRLIEEAKTEWVACLGDDDMWGRYHLEHATRAVASHPDAVAYVAQHVYTTNEGRRAIHGAPYLITETLDQRNLRFKDYWIFDDLQMGVESLLLTPFNMWSLVGRRAMLARAFTAFSEFRSGYDSDRYMFWLLARQGLVIIGREIGLFYRCHPQSATNRFLSDNRDHHMKMAAEYTKRIIDTAAKENLPLKETWLAAMRATPPQRRQEYWQAAIPGAKAALLKVWGEGVQALLPESPPASAVKRFARNLTPPIAWQLATRLKRAMRPPPIVGQTD